MVAADPVFHFAKQIFDPECYVNLNDSILGIIQASSDPMLKESQQILRRLRCRRLYRQVGEAAVLLELSERYHRVMHF